MYSEHKGCKLVSLEGDKLIDKVKKMMLLRNIRVWYDEELYRILEVIKVEIKEPYTIQMFLKDTGIEIRPENWEE